MGELREEIVADRQQVARRRQGVTHQSPKFADYNSAQCLQGFYLSTNSGNRKVTSMPFAVIPEMRSVVTHSYQTTLL
jgi:hypothetical protein